MKKLILTIGGVVLAAALGLAGLEFYKGYKASQYEKTAVPYIKMVIPEISKWDSGVIKKYMPPDSLEATSEEKMTAILKYLSRMGELEKMAEPEFSSESTVYPASGVPKEVIVYTVDTEYENGEAVFTIGLFNDGDSFQIFNFNLSSAALAQ